METKSPSLNRLLLTRLSEELDRTTPAYADECGATLNEAEAAFARMARFRDKKPLRNGWPDFLVFDELTGSSVGVEVKRKTDHVSPYQERMFSALEVAGIAVMIWDPARPTALQPWRRYTLEAVSKRRKVRERKNHLPVLGRMSTPGKRRRSL